MNIEKVKKDLIAKSVSVSMDICEGEFKVKATERYVYLTDHSGRGHLFNYHQLLCCLIAEDEWGIEVNINSAYEILEMHFGKKIYDEIMLHKSYENIQELVEEIDKILNPTISSKISKFFKG